jgi:hypothetical protein
LGKLVRPFPLIFLMLMTAAVLVAGCSLEGDSSDAEESVVWMLGQRGADARGFTGLLLWNDGTEAALNVRVLLNTAHCIPLRARRQVNLEKAESIYAGLKPSDRTLPTVVPIWKPGVAYWLVPVYETHAVARPNSGGGLSGSPVTPRRPQQIVVVWHEKATGGTQMQVLSLK